MKVLIDNNKYYKQAIKRYEYFVADEPSRLAYEARQKFLHDQASCLADARREGLTEGLEKGRAEGVREKALETAEKLLPSGLSIEKIAEATGLSVEDVKKIAGKHEEP